MQRSSRLILLFSALAVFTDSRESLGGTVSCTGCWIWMFYYLLFWQNYEKTSPRQLPMFHLCHPSGIQTYLQWSGKVENPPVLKRSEPLKNLAQYVVQSGSLLCTKLSCSSFKPQTYKESVTWLTRKCGMDKYICNLICLAVYSKYCNNIALSCIM